MTPATPKQADFANLPVSQKLALLAFNVLPMLHVLTLAGVGWVLRWHPVWDTVAMVLTLYVLPAIACRLTLTIWPMRTPTAAIGSREFFVWWFTANCQVLFCRFPGLEEALRLIPGLYSAWLRLWGSRIGKLTYWSPGTRILDRSFLRIGDRVTLGAGVRLNGHVLMHDSAGDLRLALAPIEIGDQAFIGGYSLLTAGTTVAAGEVTRAYLIAAPFTRIEAGRRHKLAATTS